MVLLLVLGAVGL